MADDAGDHGRVQDAIYRVLTYQSSTGSFGLWSPGSGDLWLDSYVTDFLTRAREQNYDVPRPGVAHALDNLQNRSPTTPTSRTGRRDRLCALCAGPQPTRPRSATCAIMPTRSSSTSARSMARAQLAASLALYGEKGRAGSAFATAFRLLMAKSENWSRTDYGSRLRDGAAMLALAAESKPTPQSVVEMIDYVTDERVARDQTSTQEKAWLLLAARAMLAEGGSISLNVNGTSRKAITPALSPVRRSSGRRSR